jgi:hypothetical protein
MSVIVNAGASQRETKRDTSSSLGGCILVIGLILFGLWFGVNKGVEFAHSILYDPEVGIQAEMELLQRTMNCEPGEVLEIRPLDDAGAKSVRCVPGDNMPPTRQDGGTRG